MYEKKINKKVIRKWMKEVWEGKYYKTLSHLHFDTIGKAFKKRTFAWVDAACEIFDSAEEIRKELKIPLELVLIFALRTRKKKNGFNFKSDKSLYRELDRWTPPEIMLLKKGQIRWERKPNIPVNWIPDKMRERKIKAYYAEGRDQYFTGYLRSYALAKV